MAPPDELRLKRLEQNYELLRSELMQVKKAALEHMAAAERLDVLRENELRTTLAEVEHLRIENARLRAELDTKQDEVPQP